MPAKNPRLTITLEPGLAAQLRRLSELTGNSQSALISELLAGSTPVFDRMIHVLEAANQAKDSMRGKLSGDLHQAQDRLEAQLGLVLETFDDGTRPILEEAERIKRRRSTRGVGEASRAAAAGVVTPLSNRGVRSGGKVPKKPGKSRG